MNTHRIGGRILAAALVAAGFGASGVAAAQDSVAPSERPMRWWIELPRADVQTAPDRLDLDGFRIAPAPNERALARRDSRGRPDRVALLERGPDVQALRALLDAGVRVRVVSRWLSMVSIEADPPALARVQSTFGRRALRPVRQLRGERATPAQPVPTPSVLGRAAGPFDYGPSEGQITQIQVDQLHALGLTGAGVRVLVLDSGFFLDHPAFAQARVVAEYDFVFDDPVTANQIEDPWYQHRHGTGVLGVLAGMHEGRLVGVAPSVELLLAKTEWVATETRTEEDDFVLALEWGEALGADVMTASLGYRAFANDPEFFTYVAADFDGDTAVTTRAVDDLVALGVVAINSAGNNGPSLASLNTPADADSVISVGAVDSLGVLAAFSSRGPTADGRIKPEVVARGRLTVWAETSGADYAQVNGTSLAAPLVAGVAALLLEAHPDWGPGALGAALLGTASQAGAPDNGMGHGIVRAHDAAFAVEPPQWPLPLQLLTPSDGESVAAPGVVFTWTRARDLQTPDGVTYSVEFAPSAAFALLHASFDAGGDTTLVIANPPAGPSWWRVRATDPEGHVRTSLPRAVQVTVATDVTRAPGTSWSAPWPNPTSSGSRLRLRLERATSAQVDVYDLAGRHVRTLVREAHWPQGERLLEWDGLDASGRPVASGAYLVRARLRSGGAAEQVVSARVVVVR